MMRKLTGIIAILTLAGWGCIEEAIDTEPLVQARAAEHVAAIRANLLRDCQEDVLEEATRRADSLLLDRASKMRRISGRPPKPNRPGAPPVKELSKPLPLRPLFPFEIRFDTLLRDSLLQDSIFRDSLYRDSIRLDLIIEE